MEQGRAEGCDFSVQAVLGCSWEDAVIGLSPQSDLFPAVVSRFASVTLWRGLLPQSPSHSVPGPVRQSRGDAASLWGAIRRLVYEGCVEVSGWQPLRQEALIHRDMGAYPCVAAGVETGRDVPVSSPWCPLCLDQRFAALVQGLSAASFLAAAIRVRVRTGFREGIQGVPGSVLPRGDAEGAPCPVRRGEVDSAQWTCVVSMPLQAVDRLPLRGGSVPRDPIDSRGTFAVVCRHSSDGQGLAAQRVGQQGWHGVHLGPLAFLRCLHDTGFKPTPGLMGLQPIDGRPVVRVVGRSTSRRVCRHVHPSLCGFLTCSRVERPRRSLPACALGHLAPPIPFLTSWPWLFFPRPLPAPPWVPLAAFLPRMRSDTGFPCSACMTRMVEVPSVRRELGVPLMEQT